MPIQKLKLSSAIGGYQWGNHGKIYKYYFGDLNGEKRAKRKAILQGIAARRNGAT